MALPRSRTRMCGLPSRWMILAFEGSGRVLNSLNGFGITGASVRRSNPATASHDGGPGRSKAIEVYLAGGRGATLARADSDPVCAATLQRRRHTGPILG